MIPCDHTIEALDSAGQPTGSWVVQTEGGVTRVVCGVCGKLYGRLDAGDKRQKLSASQAYLLQQQRRACPGCGEEPFLG